MKRFSGKFCSVLALFVIIAAASPGCRSGVPETASGKPAPLLLISIDGLRHDYIGQFDSPALDRMIDEGLYADSLMQVFPTKTFAAHYSLVTGLYPGTHGVVANSMWDPQRRQFFSMRNRKAVSDGFWFQGGEPIWVTAERQGLTAATFFWPGSEAMIKRTRPTYWRSYDGRVSHTRRINQALDWLALPDSDRPDLITLYFSRVDSRAHRDGPAADSVFAAAAEIDRQLGRLLDALEKTGRLDETNIIVVSDHGMSAVSRQRTIVLDGHLDLTRVRVSDWGPAAQIWATRMPAEKIVAALEDVPHLRVWAKQAIPERYHFGRHQRVPDVLAEADPGWLISSRQRMSRPDSPAGMHGWDPALAEMHGIFIARGPGFIPGSRSPAMASVDVYSLMARLLGLKPAKNEGRPDSFLPYLNGSGPSPAYEVRHFDCSGTRLEVRTGPEHAAVHLAPHIFVLERSGKNTFRHADLEFRMENNTAQGRLDGQTLSRCRRQYSEE